MPEHDPTIRLLHMRDYVRKAITVIEGKTRDDLEKDEILCLALMHLVTLVGETANKYPMEKQKQYPLIAWPKTISQRINSIKPWIGVLQSRIDASCFFTARLTVA